MKILFSSTLSYLPQHYCGASASINQLCESFQRKGHQVSVLAALRPGGWFAFVSRVKGFVNQKLAGCKVSKDTGFGYPVWRAWFPWEAVDFVVKRENPDVIVVVAGEIVRMALAAEKTGKPVCMHLTDVEFALHGGDFAALGAIPCIANSNFTAGVYSKKFGVTPTVIHPLIQPEKYKVASTRENVTFINPHPEKGIHIALDAAKRCPDIPFAFYKAWVLNAEQEAGLARNLAALPNVTLHEPQRDMKNVYGKGKILFVPSVWEETYGRVATEAQVSGIPVVASTRGGLPEAVGPGGIVLDPDAPIDDWVKAIRKLWQDDAYYAALSAAALTHAQRPEVNIVSQIDAYEKALLNACARAGKPLS